jgi:GNAT superfamily N-acetyltransferase
MTLDFVVKDLEGGNVDDVFRVCSHRRLDNPLQRMGIRIKRKWLLEMLEKYGPCTKVAYLDGKPVAQLLYYPEEAIPYIEKTRRDVIRLHCLYNPFPETRGRGIASSLVKSLVDEAEKGMRMFNGRRCRFIVAEPFNTGEGIPLETFYQSMGFKWGVEEMYLELTASYRPRERREYTALWEDKEKAIILYGPLCEYSYPFALRIMELIRDVEPKLPIELIDMWSQPKEASKRCGEQVIVNATPIRVWWGDREGFKKAVERALKRRL